MTKHEYLCSENHWQQPPTPLSECQARIRGSKCPGTLKRVGKGPKKEKAA